MAGMDPKDGLLIALGAFALFYIIVLGRRLMRRAPDESVTPRPGPLSVAFVANFFDTLGIGSYATTTAAFRKWKMVRDERIPGTLNVGYVLPTIVQAFIFTKLVPVEAKTLFLMIFAAIVGAWLGAGVVAHWPRRRIQIGMGTALIVAAFLMLMAFAGNVGPDYGASQLDRPIIGGGVRAMRSLAAVLEPLAALMPKGGTSMQLAGTSLAIGMAGNFILGALMTLGIGLYAPCMILIYFLGMDPKAAFPIMMGSCAFLMPVASARFIQANSFNMPVVIALMVAGVPAVLLAAPLVDKMPLDAVRILVVVVVIYAAYGLLQAARRERLHPAPADTAT